MKRSKAEDIAFRAACLASYVTDVTFRECYPEYLDQLLTNDFQCLRQWLGWQIESGNRAAVEIMKRLIAVNVAKKR